MRGRKRPRCGSLSTSAPGTAVRERGLEPLRPKTLEPKSSASTNSATRAEAATHAAATSSRLAGAARVVENSDRPDAHVEHGQFGPPDAQVAADSGSVDAEGKVELAQYNVKATGHVARVRKELGLDAA